MNRPIRSSLVLLAFAGLASAMFTVAAPFNLRFFGELLVGFVFGVALAVYFAVYEGYRNPAKIAGFVCACTVAYSAALYSAFALYDRFPANGSMGSTGLDIPLPVLFGAGYIGAFLVLAAGMFLFGPRNINWPSLGMVLLWSLGGGFLGVVGGGISSDMRPLFLIWQPGVALLLGLFLKTERKKHATPSVSVPIGEVAPKAETKRSVPVASGVFFACILASLGFLVFRTIQSERKPAEMAAAQRRSIAEAPPMVDLPPTEPLLPEQALIGKIAGLYPWLPGSAKVGQLSPVMPPAVNYFVGYTTDKDPAPGSVRRVVAVDVTQLPNAEWARYRVKYPLVNVAVMSPQSLTRVTKFGEVVVQNTANRYADGNGRLCFLWPHANFAVSVCYEARQVDEEFIRLYLEKYPSSL